MDDFLNDFIEDMEIFTGEKFSVSNLFDPYYQLRNLKYDEKPRITEQMELDADECSMLESLSVIDSYSYDGLKIFH